MRGLEGFERVSVAVARALRLSLYTAGINQKKYIPTHGVSSIEWAHYKHPLPEHVYGVYLQYWKNVELKSDHKEGLKIALISLLSVRMGC